MVDVELGVTRYDLLAADLGGYGAYVEDISELKPAVEEAFAGGLDDPRFRNFYRLLTGTATSGLALLRVVDSEFETPVAEDLVYGSGLIMFVGLPVMLMAGVPALGYARGESVKYLLITIALTVAYMLLLYLGWKVYKYFYNRRAGEAVGKQA